MIRELKGKAVKLQEGELLRREEANRQYLMKLENRYLLRNHLLEAGRVSGRGMDLNAMGGWEDPSCQLRGHFLGHWLSAAAMRYQESGDRELKAKTETILEGVRYLRIEGAFYCGIGCLFLLYGLYRALGKPGMSVVLTVISLGTRVALAYILSGIPAVGVTGIWWSVPIGWFLADVTGILYYMVQRKRLLFWDEESRQSASDSQKE